jgi:hypothetical protein
MEYQINQSNRKKIYKTMFSISKIKRSKNSYGGFATEFAGSTLNYNKMAGTPNQPTKSKKVCVVPQ